jgi:hypothetical protein
MHLNVLLACGHKGGLCTTSMPQQKKEPTHTHSCSVCHKMDIPCLNWVEPNGQALAVLRYRT